MNANTSTGSGVQWTESDLLLRARAFEVVGRLLLEAPGPKARTWMASVPELNGPCIQDVDAAAAEHQRVFGWLVFPFENVFRDDRAEIGGSYTDAVTLLAGRAGFAPGQGGPSIDHIGVELELMGWLFGRLATEGSSEIRLMASELLHEHILAWLPALAVAVDGQGSPFYSAVCTMALALCDDAAIWCGPPASVLAAPPRQGLDLENEKTSLRHIAAFLVTPGRCGLFLSRDDIRALGTGAPAGFGGRRTMLQNLLRSASRFELMGEVTSSIRRRAEVMRIGWEDRGSHTQTWHSSLDETLRVMDALDWAAQQEAPDGDQRLAVPSL
jgi:TorA maturation chaperone TorD